MGGGNYDREVIYNHEESSRHFSYSREAQKATIAEQRKCHKELNPKNKKRECRDSVEHPITTPIVVVIDNSRSRGDDAKVVFGKLPMFIGQIIMKNYIVHPVISFAAIGDATFGDKAPIQVGQFESDTRLDEVLGNMWLEEGGGGTGQESYELMAYYYARHSELDSFDRGKKGYFFFIGDEGFYPLVSKDQVKTWIGDDIPSDLPSAQVFQELQRKYHVFFVYPKKKWEDRKKDIDAEIKQRVTQAGGLYEGVDIGIRLIWNNYNDLDLHVITPSGEEIFYGNKRSRCKGWLDVDMNVQGETSKPVENTRWKKGDAPKGNYRVIVRNFRCHKGCNAATPFIVETEVNGVIKHFEGTTPSGQTGPGSDVVVYEFNYDPNDRPIDTDAYAGYDDTLIKNQWASVIPEENILIIDDPKAIVDVMLGALAITEGSVDLDQYASDMIGRSQTDSRVGLIKTALNELANKDNKVSTDGLPEGLGEKRKSRTTRL